MTEQELRVLVREAIARHLSSVPDSQPRAGAAPRALPLHPSHAQLALHTGSDADGPCLIEPAVTCNHCGYCRSLGH